jgi:HK97 gp10 family phage protein
MAIVGTETVVVTGMEEAQKNLDLISNQMQKTYVRNAIKSAAEVFRREVRAKAPVRVDEYEKSKNKKGATRGPGYLKSHIGRWIKPQSDGSLSAFVGPTPTAFYGAFVEKGHRNIRTRAEKLAEHYGAARRALVTAEFGGKDTPPHPFMRPAFDAKHEEAQKVFGEELWKQIQGDIKS